MTPTRYSELMPQYFLIKIGKEEQKEKKEKMGSLYFPSAYTYMRRELQWGTIEQIGTEAGQYFPQAEIGDFLLIHHMATGKKTDKGYNFFLVDEDADFNYYIINGFEFNGDRNLVYGIAKGTEIIPSPDYIFLELEQVQPDSYVSSSGLTLVPEKKKTRAEWSEIMKKNLARCKQLARNLPQNQLHEQIIMANARFKELYQYSFQEIKRLEAENLQISKNINKKRYVTFKALFINPDWNEAVERSFGEKINPGEFVYMLNLACNTEVDILGKTYIVAENKYFSGSLNYMKQIVSEFNGTTSHNNIASQKVSS
jgi:hypothetical protein